MRTVTQLTTAICNSTLAPQQAMQPSSMQMQNDTMQSKQEPSSQLTEALRTLFKQWKAWFKNKMKTREDDFDWSFDMVLVWARYLTMKAITQPEFNRASELSFDEDWVPSNAKEFLALARAQKASEYPSAQAAFDNACNQCGLIEDKYVKRQWLHAVVLETANRIGWGKLKNANEYFLKTFTGVYEQVISEHQNGSTFVIPKSHQVEYERTVVKPGSEVDRKINKQLAELRRVAV